MTGPYNKKSQGSLCRLTFFKILLVAVNLYLYSDRMGKKTVHSFLILNKFSFGKVENPCIY